MTVDTLSFSEDEMLAALDADRQAALDDIEAWIATRLARG